MVKDAERVVPFLADAIAIALGYTAHPRVGGNVSMTPVPHPREHFVAAEDCSVSEAHPLHDHLYDGWRGGGLDCHRADDGRAAAPRNREHDRQ